MILDNTSLLLPAAPAAMLIVSLASVRQAGPSPLTVERLGVGAGAFSLNPMAVAEFDLQARPRLRPSGGCVAASAGRRSCQGACRSRRRSAWR